MEPEKELVEAIEESWRQRLVGGPRYYWCREDSSLVVDVRHEYFVWGRRGLRGDIGVWRRISEIEKMPGPPKDRPEYYGERMGKQAYAWWEERGISKEMVAKYELGRCSEWDTYTIPIYKGGELLEIKHRFGDRKKDRSFPGELKYGHEPAGRFHIFNSDILAGQSEVCFVAGEIKAMVLTEAGIPTLSTTGGLLAWNPAWNDMFRKCERVYICFDPFEEWAAHRIASCLGWRAWIVYLPCPADRLLMMAEGGVKMFREHLGHAEPYGITMHDMQYRHVHYGTPLGATNPISPGLWRWI